jgi:hypothetical protein
VPSVAEKHAHDNPSLQSLSDIHFRTIGVGGANFVR